MLGTVLILQFISIPLLFVFMILEIFYVLIVSLYGITLCRKITNLNNKV